MPIVRLIVGITLMLVGVGMLSCRVENNLPVVTKGQWVRTADGWERTEPWYQPALSEPRLHPLVVAAGEGLLSTLALIAFRREDTASSG